MRQRQHITATIYDKKGRVLSRGVNSYVKTHPIQAKYAELADNPLAQFLHAEIHALVRCRNLKKAHRIVVTRVLRDGTLGTAKPCPVCMLAIQEAGISEIEWSE